VCSRIIGALAAAGGASNRRRSYMNVKAAPAKRESGERLSLDWILDSVIDGRTKGWPPQTPAARVRDIASLGLNLFRGDLPTPVAILRRRALDLNSSWMRRFLELTGAAVCPHGKTTMAPQLFARQLEDGAWGITVATRQQLEVALCAGVRRQILANELVAPSDMDWVAAELDRNSALELYLYVDSIELVRRWAEVRRKRPGRPIELLLEIGFAGGRTGARTDAEAVEIAERIRAESGLRLSGIAGFEGLIRGDSPALAAERVRAFLGLMVKAAEDCARRGLFADEPVILTAGGSAYYDLVAEVFGKADLGRPARVVLRSGCYLTHDHQMYANYVENIIARSPMLSTETVRPAPALEVWASVQSVPEPGLAICSVGKRDISFDVDLPIPVAWRRLGRDRKSQPLEGHVVAGLNDQHAMVRRPADSPLKVGDLVGFGISHPCTTFDRWPLLYLIDEEGTVLEGIRTFF
jgi:D-serine dehydratase